MVYNNSLHYDYLFFKIQKKTDIIITIQLDYSIEKNNYICKIMTKKGHEIFKSDTDLQKQINLALNLIINDIFSLETKKNNNLKKPLRRVYNTLNKKNI